MTGLQLIRITHYRCADHDCVTFTLAPDSWTQREVKDRVQKARERYLEAFDAAAAQVPRVAYVYSPNLADKALDPAMTIGEARADFEVRQLAYREAEQARQYTARTFEDFLTDEGFVSLWSTAAEAVEADVRWGHRHGQRLRYGNDEQIDQWPSPRKLHALLTGQELDEDEEGWFA